MEKRSVLIAIGIIAILIVGGLATTVLSQDDEGDENSPTTLKQKGSDTMLELCQIWSEEFKSEYDWITIEVSGGGSGTGITALIAKEVQMAQASRAMKQSELEAASAAGIEPVEFKVAIDGIAIIVHSSNSIADLTMDQLRGLYNGTITNWNQLGGPDKSVTLYGRQSSSGTYAYFEEVVLKDDSYSIEMQMLQGNSAIVSAVAGDESGIGYVGIGYVNGISGIKVLDLKKNETSDPTSPLDEEAIYNGDYALSRYLYIYTSGTPTGDERTWLEWILTADKGQEVAVEIGFYALPTDVLAEERSKLEA